jgi:hypothetical protein
VKGKMGLDLVDYIPDYTKTLEENNKIYRQKYFEAYGEYPPEPEGNKKN